jgi:peptidoglycan/LPS O-acetylase OafA/YrhL
MTDAGKGGERVPPRVADDSTIAARPPAQRDDAVDYCRGLLVLSMVLYHTLNYFSPGSSVFRWLGYISAGFVLVAGYVTTHMTLPRYRGSPWKMLVKLVARGGKLLLLFTILNLLANLFFSSNFDGRTMGLTRFLGNLWPVYGPGDPDTASFEVLVPISYVLLIAGPVLAFVRPPTWVLVPSLLGLGIYATLGFQGIDIPYNLRLTTYGLLGMVLGVFPDPPPREVSSITRLLLVFIGVVFYAGLTIWFPDFLPGRAAAVIVIMYTFYQWGRADVPGGFLKARVSVLGRYSLAGYLLQICFLQVMKRVAGPVPVSDVVVAALVLLVVVLTSGAIELLHAGTTRSRFVAVLYRGVFG